MRQRIAEIIIRPMTLDDLPEVQIIDRMSFPLPWSERSYRFEIQENPAAHLLTAERVEEPARILIGYVGFWIIVDEVHISTLAVHPLYRRQGIGERLLIVALRMACDIGAEIATLEVRVSNQAAVCLYRKYGFEIIGRRKRYYRDNGEDALLMTLQDLRWSLEVLDGGEG